MTTKFEPAPTVEEMAGDLIEDCHELSHHVVRRHGLWQGSLKRLIQAAEEWRQQSIFDGNKVGLVEPTPEDRVRLQ